MRCVEAGYRESSLSARSGRATSTPPQFGQLPRSVPSAHVTQNVHSNEQIRASADPGGRSLSQHSQLGLISSIAISVPERKILTRRNGARKKQGRIKVVRDTMQFVRPIRNHTNRKPQFYRALISPMLVLREVTKGCHEYSRASNRLYLRMHLDSRLRTLALVCRWRSGGTAPAGAQNGKVVIDPALYDLNRVEVLRGPQGTLYGSGSMGGTVKLVPNQPNPSALDASAEIIPSHTDGGGFNRAENAMVNLPFGGGTAALRI